MRPRGSVLLGISSASIFQDLEAWVNSASTSCPFGNRPTRPAFQQRICVAEQLVERRQRARRHDVERSLKSSTKSSIRRAWTMAGSAGAATASRRNAAFLLMLSTRWTAAPGRSAERAGDDQAGKAGAGAEIDPASCVRRRAAGAGANRRHGGSRSSGSWTARSGCMRLLPLEQRARRTGRAAPMFHVKQVPTSASARARSARACSRPV